MNRRAIALDPVAAGERIDLLDVLRGFALLGILLVNFSGSPGERIAGIDRAVNTGLDILVAESFYPLFSFLFGLGFAVQLLRARERGLGVAHLYLRRLLVLFLIGTAHAVLIWDGDILVEYALFGLLLIPLSRLPARGVLLVALGLFAFSLNTNRVRELMSRGEAGIEVVRRDELVQGVRDERFRVENNRRMREALETGEERTGYTVDVSRRWETYGTTITRLTNWIRVLGNDIPMLFLIGLYVGRRRWLQEAARYRRGFAVAAAVGAVVAVAGNFVLQREALPQIGTALGWTAANLGVTAFYVAVLAILVTGGGRAGRRLRIFAPVGRMGLTNYLMQSVVMTWPFLSYGLGFPQPSTTAWVLLNLTFFFAIQVPLSHLWLRRYQYGPMEWLWRTLTYGVPQPMRRSAGPPAEEPALAPMR